MSIKKLTPIVLILFSAGTASAATLEDNHILSLGAGIASPSLSTALGENPAGLIYNSRPKLLVDVSNHDTEFDGAQYGGTFFTGNRTVGAGVGITKDQGSDQTALRFGLGAGVRSMNFAVGVSGRYRLNGVKIGDDLGVDVGALFNPYGRIKFGVTAFDVTNEVQGVGGGLAYSVNRNATLAVDATSDKDLDGLSIKPALNVRLSSVQLSYGYGVQIDKDHAPRFMSLKSTVGAALDLSQNFVLEFYYNQVSKYYLGAMIRL